jgi:hypothetical protein
MDAHKRVFVVTCRIEGMKFSEIRERFLRRFCKPGHTDNAVRALVN